MSKSDGNEAPCARDKITSHVHYTLIEYDEEILSSWTTIHGTGP